VHLPALNHIGLWVDNIQNAVDILTEKGVRFAPGGIRKGAGNLNLLFSLFLLFIINIIIIYM
jgi:lactoylglutathione lyase